MITEFYLSFPTMPTGTAQQTRSRIIYKAGQAKIQHYKKDSVSRSRRMFELALLPHKPKEPMQGPVKLLIVLYFDVKSKKLWGHYKTTRPDAENYAKEFIDAMTTTGFWKDDSQIVDLRIIKRFAEKAEIFVRVEDLDD